MAYHLYGIDKVKSFVKIIFCIKMEILSLTILSLKLTILHILSKRKHVEKVSESAERRYLVKLFVCENCSCQNKVSRILFAN